MTQFSQISLMTMPDSILGTQHHPGQRYTAEQRLMWALLGDAFYCLQKGLITQATTRGKRILAEERAWIAADDTTWPFSFVNVCAALGLEADYIRKGLHQWESAPVVPHPLCAPQRSPLPPGIQFNGTAYAVLDRRNRKTLTTRTFASLAEAERFHSSLPRLRRQAA